MTQENPAPETSYRALGLFWAIILTGAGCLAVVLQTLGPPPHARPPAIPAARTQPAPARAEAAAGVAMAAPDPALQEPAPDFPGRFLPRIGPDLRAPATVYALPFNAADKRPRIAIVISGAGLDEEQTLHAIADLPREVDLAFSAYTPEQIQGVLAARARAAGHECLQSIPMEPAGYPLSEEGLRALLTGADREQNRQNLEWALARLPGCVGATGASDGLAGERYAQNGQGFADILIEAEHRGLIFLDARTGAPALATNGGPSVKVVDMVVDQSPNTDTPPTAEVIDTRLAALERSAVAHGAAIGLAGPPRPVTLERIALWAKGLAARGVALAPLSAMPGLPAPPPPEDGSADQAASPP